MTKKIISILGIIVILTACSNKITEGEVYDKEHNEAYTTVNVIPFCISNGKSTSCTPIPYTIHHQESFEIHIRSYNKKENKYDKATYYVQEDDYKKIKIGDMFKFDEDTMLDEEPVIKERLKE